MQTTDMMKRAAAGAAMAGAFGLSVLGFGSGISSAKPHNPGPNPPGPIVQVPGWPGGNGIGDNEIGDDNDLGDVGDIEDGNGVLNPVFNPLMPPGHNPIGPPGQVMKMPTINGLPNPFFNVPPGQWPTVDLNPVNFGLPTTWMPDGVTVPLPLVFDPVSLTWGVNVNGNFVPYVAPVVIPTP